MHTSYTVGWHLLAYTRSCTGLEVKVEAGLSLWIDVGCDQGRSRNVLWFGRSSVNDQVEYGCWNSIHLRNSIRIYIRDNKPSAAAIERLETSAAILYWSAARSDCVLVTTVYIRCRVWNSKITMWSFSGGDFACSMSGLVNLMHFTCENLTFDFLHGSNCDIWGEGIFPYRRYWDRTHFGVGMTSRHVCFEVSTIRMRWNFRDWSKQRHMLSADLEASRASTDTLEPALNYKLSRVECTAI